MNKIWNALVRNPKKAMLAGLLAMAVLLPIASNAWGPDRTTFTIENPADYVVFNSITNNPAHGDERNFVQIKEASASNSTYAEHINIEPGKKYTVFVYFHNNAAANLNLTAYNTRMNTQLPNVVEANQETSISAKVMSDNAHPKTVWDEAKVTAAQKVALKYVANSATIYSKGAVNGQKLNSNEFLTTSGALIGYKALDGEVPGCSQFAGYVTYDFIVESLANFTFDKTVSLANQKQYGENVATTDNQTVDFRLVYTNTSGATQENVIIKDVLPEGLEYVAGSTYVANKNSNGKYVQVSDNIGTTGINIGSYTAGSNAFIKFSAKIKDFDCGQTIHIVNYAQAITKEGTKIDSASVTVKTEDCPIINDIQVCELSTKKIVTIKENAFDASKYSKDLSKCDTPEDKNIQVCELNSKKIVVIKENDFDANKHTKDLSRCNTPVVKDIRVCELSTKKIVTIKENAFDTNKHSKNQADCNTKPQELPDTGMGEVIMSVVGLGSVTASLAYYIDSRKLLKNRK